MLLKDADYIILSDVVNAHIDQYGDKHVLRSGPLAGRIITFATTDRVTRFEPEIDRILDALGYPEALVTDESTLGDFSLEPLEYARAEEALGLQFATNNDLLVDIAERLRGGQ
jgi:hypothetical protein